MDIVINGQKLEFSLENEKTIGDILRAIESDCSKNNATIVSISIDNTIVNESEFDAIFKQAIDSTEALELETMTENDVSTLLQNSVHTLQETIENLLKIPVLLQSSKDTEVASIVIDFTVQFKTIQKLMYYCSLFPQKFNSFVIEGQSVSTFFQDFTPILQEFESSLESHDTVLTGDLAEYEIVPKLQSFVDATNTLYGATC